MENKNGIRKLRIFTIILIVFFIVSIFLIYDKIDIDSITYLKYLH